jgi:hypothetical protein
VDSNFTTMAYAADLWSMQMSHYRWQKPGHFCGMSHSAPRRTIPHHAVFVVPRDAALVPQLFWQILKCGNSEFCVALMQQDF